MKSMPILVLGILLGHGYSSPDLHKRRLRFHETLIYKDQSGATPPSIDIMSGLPIEVDNVWKDLSQEANDLVAQVNGFSAHLRIQLMDSGEGNPKRYSLFMHGEEVLEGIRGVAKWQASGTRFLLALNMAAKPEWKIVTKIVHNYKVSDWDYAGHGDTYPALLNDGLVTLDYEKEKKSGNDSDEMVVAENGKGVYRFKVHEPVRGPIRSFFTLNGIWYLQLTNVLIANGKSVNAAGGFEEVFNGREFGGNLLYMAKRGKTYGIYYGGKPIGKPYGYIPHDFCCGNGMMNVMNGERKIGLFGFRKGLWYYSTISSGEISAGD